MALSLGADGDERKHMLIESLQATAQRHALNALSAIALFKERGPISLAIQSLESQEGGQRANALEALESIGEAELVRPLIALWDAASGSEAASSDFWQEALLDPDAWLRACGVLYAAHVGEGELRRRVDELSRSDPDALVRETAAQALQGDHPMETLQTIPTMERILFLRRVTLFANLTPLDLKQIAGIARERLFTDGEVIAEKGDPGDEMYVIASGEVRVLGENGGELARRVPGDSVGEMAIISRQPRMATLRAQGDVRLLCIDQEQFEGILRERFEISLAVMRELCQRLRESSDRRNL
jgi:hypothetical protein